MLDLAYIRRNPEIVKESVQRRNLDADLANVDRLLEVDAECRDVQTQRDDLRHEQGQLGKKIKKATPEERQALVARVKEIKTGIAEAEARYRDLDIERKTIHSRLPNLLEETVPDGKSDEENLEIRQVGEKRELGFEARDHVELGRLTDTIDFERGAKVAGAAFYYLKREGALLEQALMSYAASILMPEGFVPMITPELARDEVLAGIGFQPRGNETQVYSIDGEDLSLIGTAEITLGGYHKDEIFEASELPIQYVGFSRCFRTEAGAHGRESRGLYRVHEFTKAEMFVICSKEESTDWHERLIQFEERVMQGLEIPYRVVNVCAGDLGAPAFKKYDIEAWMPGRGRYGEVTSCSNCTDYQARRLGVRYRPEAGAKPQPVHMLNGTAIAVSRALIAIFENHQLEDGSITIPEILRPFCGGLEVIPRRLEE